MCYATAQSREGVCLGNCNLCAVLHIHTRCTARSRAARERRINAMNETNPKVESSQKSRKLLSAVTIIILIAAGVVVTQQFRKVDDAALSRDLVGTWSAVDPTDGSLHRRELPVSAERLEVGDDGTLTHVVELAEKPKDPDRDRYEWKVRKGRLYVRYLADNSGGEWLRGIPLSIADGAMSMRIKDHLPKEWVRQ
jgi:hypothetical protein